MDEDSSLTFETIRRIHIEERTFSKLSKLPDNFYDNIRKYMDKKVMLSDGRRDDELKNVKRMIEDIFDRRERKILTCALTSARTKIPPDNLSPEEEDFFNKLTKTITKRRDELLSKVFNPGKSSMVKVVFKKDTDEFMSSDMTPYGPFKKGDVAKIPDENFKILEERNVVEEESG